MKIVLWVFYAVLFGKILSSEVTNDLTEIPRGTPEIPGGTEIMVNHSYSPPASETY